MMTGDALDDHDDQDHDNDLDDDHADDHDDDHDDDHNDDNYDHDDTHVPSAAIKPLFITAHVPKRKYGHNVVQIVSVCMQKKHDFFLLNSFG